MPKINAGETVVSLNGEDFTLKASLRVAKDLNRQFDSLGNAIDQLRKANFDSVVSVIRIGANLQGRDARDLEEKVFAEMGASDNAFGDLLVSMIQFVALVQRGGRPLDDDNYVKSGAADEGN